MLNLVLSLSLLSGAFLVALISALVTLAVASAWRSHAVWFLAVLAPFGIACCLYWLPAWSGQDASEYAAWAPIFIIPWFLAGTCASLLVVLLVRRVQRRGVACG